MWPRMALNLCTCLSLYRAEVLGVSTGVGAHAGKEPATLLATVKHLPSSSCSPQLRHTCLLPPSSLHPEGLGKHFGACSGHSGAGSLSSELRREFLPPLGVLQALRLLGFPLFLEHCIWNFKSKNSDIFSCHCSGTSVLKCPPQHCHFSTS